MLRDVDIEVKDGSLGIVASSGTGVHVKIGISPVASALPLLITGTMKPDAIKQKLGLSPLADACIDSVENGASTIYCIPVVANTPGAVSEIKKTASGPGTLTADGEPNNNYDIRLQVEDPGQTNSASFIYSIDGGYSYRDEMTVPVNGSFEIPDTGITVLFKDAAGGEGTSFESGDLYTFSTTAPSVSNKTILDAVESLVNSNLAFEYVHIIGESSKALWASLAQEAEDFLSIYKKPLFFVCESRYIHQDESMDAYVQAITSEVKGINSRFIQVVAAYSQYTRWDGRNQRINNAGIVCGLYSLARESQSIGETKTFAISSVKLERLLPEWIEDYISILDNANLLTFRQYYGLDGYFVNNARILSASGSDFRYAEDIRVSNRLIKDVRAAALGELQTEVDMDDLETSLAYITAILNTPVEKAVDDGIISSGTVVINMENLNILADESIEVSISYVPKGHIRSMLLSFAMENPYRN